MSDRPNLAGVATSELVESIGTGKFSASYINWSRTMQLMREHAAGWMPELVPSPQGDVLHRAPVGGYLMIRFRNGEQVTEAVPQAVMDVKNQSVPWERITSRDITDTHRRGVCMAAAFTFGLAYELWAKIALESGYGDHDSVDSPQHQNPAPKSKKPSMTPEQAAEIKGLLMKSETDVASFLAWLVHCLGVPVPSVDEAPAEAYRPSKERLEKKIAGMTKEPTE